MEKILHYIWKHKLFPVSELCTQDGLPVEVVNPGVLNTDAGPDFIGAKVKIDGLLWAGNVEIHVHTSDWFRHKHDKNRVYDSIILHVASDIDTSLSYPSGEVVPQIQIEVPTYVLENYDYLISRDTYPPCREVIHSIPKFHVHNWLSALRVERLEMRTHQIMDRRERLDKNWEDTLFVTVARSFGFGKNGDAFESWANAIPMGAVGKHRDNFFQVLAIFYGQAGMLDGTGLSGMDEEEYRKLCAEYKYLAVKFSLTPIQRSEWNYLRLRPQNFPHVRIQQLATLYFEGRLTLSKMLNAKAVDDYMRMFEVESKSFSLSKASKQSLLINCVSPMLFAYGCYRNDEDLKEKAVDMLEQLKPEDNHIIKEWGEAGVEAEHAADSQALIHLYSNYCKKHDCLRCRFGHEYLSHNPGWLKEKSSMEIK